MVAMLLELLGTKVTPILRNQQLLNPSSNTKSSTRTRTTVMAAQQVRHGIPITSRTETMAEQFSAQGLSPISHFWKTSMWSIFKSLEQTPFPIPSKNKNQTIRMRWFDTNMYTTYSCWASMFLPTKKSPRGQRKDAPISFWKLKYVFETNPPPSLQGKPSSNCAALLTVRILRPA